MEGEGQGPKPHCMRWIWSSSASLASLRLLSSSMTPCTSCKIICNDAITHTTATPTALHALCQAAVPMLLATNLKSQSSRMRLQSSAALRRADVVTTKTSVLSDMVIACHCCMPLPARCAVSQGATNGEHRLPLLPATT